MQDLLFLLSEYVSTDFFVDRFVSVNDLFVPTDDGRESSVRSVVYIMYFSFT